MISIAATMRASGAPARSMTGNDEERKLAAQSRFAKLTTGQQSKIRCGPAVTRCCVSKQFARSIVLTAMIMAGPLTPGCHSDSNDSESSDLSGAWSFLTTDADGAEAFQGELIIVDLGSRVILTDCDRNDTELIKDGSELNYPDGRTYYLSIFSSSELRGFGDTGNVSRLVKKEDRTWFDSGSLEIAMDSYPAMDTAYDVCAINRPVRYASASGEFIARGVNVSAPYADSFINLMMNFRELSVGSYEVVPRSSRDLFEMDGGRYSLVDIESPEFETEYGQSLVGVTGGTISLHELSGEAANMSGELVTFDGKSLLFAAQITFIPWAQ